MSYSTKVINSISSKDFLKMCSLSYIAEKNDSAYGREILENLKDNLKDKDSLWFPSHGSLYPSLRELVEGGYLYVEEEEGKRKYYKLTQEGKDYYKKASVDFVDTLQKTSDFYQRVANDLISIDKVEGE